MPSEDHFRCLDMCYIAALLHDGLGLDKTATLHVSHKNHADLSWGLQNTHLLIGSVLARIVFNNLSRTAIFWIQLFFQHSSHRAK